jgi:hypothetical protein
MPFSPGALARLSAALQLPPRVTWAEPDPPERFIPTTTVDIAIAQYDCAVEAPEENWSEEELIG